MQNLNENIASVWIEHNQNTVARRDYCLFEKLAVVGRLFWQLGTCFSNRCRCGVVKTRVNTGTEKSPFVERWPLWRGGR